MAERLRLADLWAGLSMVADMGYGLPPGQAMRSCLIGVALARRLNLSEAEVADTFYTSLLVHVGCVGFAQEMASVFGDENVANRAGARTNFADPRDVVTTLIPETTRDMAPAARIRRRSPPAPPTPTAACARARPTATSSLPSTPLATSRPRPTKISVRTRCSQEVAGICVVP